MVITDKATEVDVNKTTLQNTTDNINNLQYIKKEEHIRFLEKKYKTSYYIGVIHGIGIMAFINLIYLLLK